MQRDRSRPPALEAWHRVVSAGDPGLLDAVLADDVVFCSPALHQPQEGRALTATYLSAALVVLGPTLTYHRQWWDDEHAVLEFHADVDGLDTHGVDIISWDETDLISAFTVMVRPWRALEHLMQRMREQLPAPR